MQTLCNYYYFVLKRLATTLLMGAAITFVGLRADAQTATDTPPASTTTSQTTSGATNSGTAVTAQSPASTASNQPVQLPEVTVVGPPTSGLTGIVENDKKRVKYPIHSSESAKFPRRGKAAERLSFCKINSLSLL
jgi:hypothetical protein